jgi:nicotinate-nucleotide--dimethylbenzimidazole phosphoribosyltransferase
MVSNYLAGGAAINALCDAADLRLLVADAGVVGELPETPQLRRLGLRRGSGNIAREPALTLDEASTALLAGAALAHETIDSGVDLLALGEMGIANTTPAAALASAFTGHPPASSVGRGTGVDDAGLARKRGAVAAALERARSVVAAPPSPERSLRLLAELGGLELAVLAGATLAAASQRVPVLLDGYITAAAALVAVGLAPAARDHLFAAHCSAEPGHALVLTHLGLSAEGGAGPLLRLDLRLGEGSGAALAVPLLRGAAHLMARMATFAQAGVAEA